MAVERSNPLPVGRYWVDIPPSDTLSFNIWKQTHRDLVKVRAVSTGANGWEWHLFDVLSPVLWGPWGFPNIADEGVDGPEDVYKVPHVEQPDSVAMIERALWGAGAILLAAVALNRLLK